MTPIRAAVLHSLRVHRGANEGLTVPGIAYALRRDTGVTADLADVKRAVVALCVDELAYRTGETYVALGPAAVTREAPPIRRNGTRVRHVHRSSYVMPPTTLPLRMYEPHDASYA